MTETYLKSWNRSLTLEALLVAATFCITGMVWLYAIDIHVILDLYYIPVVLTAFFRGKYRARMMAFFCILAASALFLPSIYTGTTLVSLLSFTLWCTTLLLIAMLVGSLCEDREVALNKLQESHRKDALTDIITGIANRRAFEFELSRRLADWNRTLNPFCLILIDIDFFKKFNDRYGHPTGDVVLGAFAKVLENAMRDQDLVARHGGEEFGIVLPNTQIEVAKEVAERMRCLIEESRFPHRGLQLRLTASIGIAQILPGEDISSLLQRTDAALYGSKEAGRNCASFHDGTHCQRFGQGIATETTSCSSDSTQTAKSNDTYTDDTTGAPTQKVFLEEFRRRTAESHRYGGNLSIAIVTIDQLRENSDIDAHARKCLLASIARLASSNFREIDLVARYNANSIGVLFPATSLLNVTTPLVRLQEDTNRYHDPQYPSLDYHVSIGAVQITPTESAGATLARVECALKMATDAGGNTICMHDGSTYQFERSPHLDSQTEEIVETNPSALPEAK